MCISIVARYHSNNEEKWTAPKLNMLPIHTLEIPPSTREIQLFICYHSKVVCQSKDCMPSLLTVSVFTIGPLHVLANTTARLLTFSNDNETLRYRGFRLLGNSMISLYDQIDICQQNSLSRYGVCRLWMFTVSTLEWNYELSTSRFLYAFYEFYTV